MHTCDMVDAYVVVDQGSLDVRYRRQQRQICVCVSVYAAQEASWERRFDPIYTLLFGLYH